MPKEISHWYLADLVKQNLPAESVFKEPVTTHENLFFLGAVTPDIPFYYLVGPGSARIQAAARPFHRSDARALAPVLTFFDRMGGAAADPGALSLGAGIVCHILADTAFHPLVYYHSGQSRIHPGAAARHRQFETALDLYFRHQAGTGVRVSLHRILSETETADHQLYGYLAALFDLNDPGDKTWLKYAIRSHALYQAIFQNPGFYRILTRLNKRRLWLLDLALALFYPPGQGGDLPFFDRMFQYRDPVSGRYRSDRIPDLARQAATDSLAVLSRISDGIKAKQSLSGLAENAGLPRVRPGISPCRFWRRQPDLFTELYRRKK